MSDTDVLRRQMRIIFGNVFLGKTQSSLFRRREFFVIERLVGAPGKIFKTLAARGDAVCGSAKTHSDL
jgi:hypothetical protein